MTTRQVALGMIIFSVMNKIKQYFPHILLSAYLVEFVCFAANPVSGREVWFIENLPVMIIVFLLVVTFHKFRFSNTSYFLMGFAMMYHTFGGHYSFEFTPFEFGNSMLEYLNFDFLFPEGRNNFDRVGHYLTGVFAYPIAELALVKRWVSSRWVAIVFGIFAIGFLAATYEVVETVYALVEGGAAGSAFLGSQGDIWDAQKDMLLDILGAVTVSILFWFKFKK